MARLSVTKCQGTGNDFVLVESEHLAPARYADLARRLCDRRFGVGADGMLVVAPNTTGAARFAIRIFNADGSEAETCGNGLRCVARYIQARRGIDGAFAIGLNHSVAWTELRDNGEIRVQMGVPDVQLHRERVTVAGMLAEWADVRLDNAHCVLFVDREVAAIDLPAVAAGCRAMPSSQDVNVEVAHVAGGSTIDMRVDERGVAETWACGSGACATAAAAIASHRIAGPAHVAMRGGVVTVEWAGGDSPAFLTGDAQIVFEADVEVPSELLRAALPTP